VVQESKVTLAVSAPPRAKRPKTAPNPQGPAGSPPGISVGWRAVDCAALPSP